MTEDRLPIEDALPALVEALDRGATAVLAAPPGAGKTTRVPLALMGRPWAEGRIVMLEPRRLAARAAAHRMAETLGEPVGRRVGYRIRGERKVSRDTRIEVVTEGILTRMIQADPELSGVSAVIFDEVHERSIHTDLGLALALEAQEALRPDLRLLAMSATLDTAAWAGLMGGAPVIESAGKIFPVETRWLETPRPRGPRAGRIEDAVAARIREALEETSGDLLAFLPGRAEIARTAERLKGLSGVAVRPLHGGLPFAEQRAALTAEADGSRRVVLATAIAETSLTVEGVRVVVDAGLARRSRTDPSTGMARLVTVPASRAEADQRRGRAGREGPGTCYRLWTRAEEGAMPAFAPAEILEADLAPLALELAAWGADDPAALAFLDPPPAPALTEARALLEALGALDAGGRITAHGRELAGVAAHPRLAHMLLVARGEGLEGEAALLAALVEERDPLRDASAGADLAPRLAALAAGPKAPEAAALDRAAAERIRAEARRLSPERADRARAADRAGPLLALAYPDRVGLRRKGEAPRYLLSQGRGATLADGDPLGAARLVVACDVEDRGREAAIRRAARLAEADLRAAFAGRIRWTAAAEWSRRERRVVAREREMFGALALAERIWRDAPPEALGAALADGIRDRGLDALPWPNAAEGLRARVLWLATQEGALASRLPDWSDEALLAALDDWLVPYLAGMTRIEEIAALDLHAILRASLGEETARAVDRAAPAAFETPLGDRATIDYARETPTLAIRVQELFGVTEHPTIGDPPIPLVLELLSPARRPVQTTRDLPGFWADSYREVAKEMRARYPRHPWPDDPAAEAPTRRARPRASR